MPAPIVPRAKVEPIAMGGRAPPPLIEASLGAAGTFGMAPHPALGATLGVTVRWASVSLGVEGLVDAPSSTVASAGGRVSAWLAFGAVVPCAYVWRLFLCAEAQAGSLQSSGEATPGSRSTSTTWWAVGARAGAMVALSPRFALRVRGDLVLDLAPTELLLDGSSAWTAPTVAGSLGIDGVVRF